MPKRTDIETILILGSGPIIIGQACEFDYSGTQSCRVLKKLGYRIVLVNSNPATIMTDPEMADRTYVEPLTPEVVAQIIERERPDALLPTMGGQTALNLAYDLHERGTLQAAGVELIGARFEAIQKAESRELFGNAMRRVGLEVPRGRFVRSLDEAMELLEEIDLPVILRPAFTLGGTGGGTVFRREEYRAKVNKALTLSPVHEVLIEQSVIGWKEYELEVMRDRKDNFVVVCSIENLDPMGVHTGDSITVAPAQTLTDKEYQIMRDAARLVMTEIGVETGGSNVQFAVNPRDGRMVVIEMNPRVSRSSALASKATGFPIAKIAAMLAVGFTLDEIPNDITKKTPACFEPSIDYVVTKVPRWDFEKFPGTEDVLGVQMKSVGEAMAIGRNFPESLQKAMRSLEKGHAGLGADGKDYLDVTGPDPAALKRLVRRRLKQPHPNNLFYVKYGLQLGLKQPELTRLTGIDPWFIDEIAKIAAAETSLRGLALADVSREQLHEAKRLGFSDRQLGHLFGCTEDEVRHRRRRLRLEGVFKTVDTCAAEFAAETPYYYSTYEEENEALPSKNKKIIILGGGPNRIGQGIEFDYCCVHGVFALKEEGYEVQMINCNPETVSTDYDITDRLFFEPLTFEDVMRIIENEKPYGVIVQFGGQTPLKLALPLHRAGVRVLGTSPDSIDLAEDRKRFGALLKRLRIPHPAFGTAFSAAEAREVARTIGYPVLVRPSYVLGGRGMKIVYDDKMLAEYMREAVQASPEHPVLIDKFLEDAFEFDVDAIYDGRSLYIGGIMQHIEEAGIHSGDSACVLPPYLITDEHLDAIREYTLLLARELKVKGLLNIQYAMNMKDGLMQVLEVNPRASRTVPFVSKATGVPLAKVAARVMIGRTLKELGLKQQRIPRHVSVKEAVMPFNKFADSNVYLGPEMKSTGEVMGIAASFGNAYAKSQIAAGGELPTRGTLFISVNDNDKFRIIPIARDFVELGFRLVATEGTARSLRACAIDCGLVHKVGKGSPTLLDLIRRGEIQLIINTPLGKVARTHEYEIGHAAIAHNVPYITTLSAASAAVRGIMSIKQNIVDTRCLQDYHREMV